MNRRLYFAAVLGFALVSTACGGIGNPIPAHSENAFSTSIGQSGTMLQAGIDPSRVVIMRTLAASRLAGPNALLTYRNGPVERKPAVYVIYWGFNARASDPSGEIAYMNAFLNGIGGSGWLNIEHQYYEIVGGVKKRIHNSVGQLKGTWIDTTAIPASPTDAQIQAAAARGVAHFGYDKDASYVVATSHNHDSGGFGSQYCAYHGAFGSGRTVASYTNLPYITDAGANCGQNFINSGSGGLLDGVSIVEGHELAESQTDPIGNTGWLDSVNGEIGDICAWKIPPAADITLSTGTFAVQGLWSNNLNRCAIFE